MPPGFAAAEVFDVLLHLDTYNTVIVLPEVPTQQTASLPAYLLYPCDLLACFKAYGSLEADVCLDVKIYDFGNGMYDPCCPLQFTDSKRQLDGPGKTMALTMAMRSPRPKLSLHTASMGIPGHPRLYKATSGPWEPRCVVRIHLVTVANTDHLADTSSSISSPANGYATALARTTC